MGSICKPLAISGKGVSSRGKRTANAKASLAWPVVKKARRLKCRAERGMRVVKS